MLMSRSTGNVGRHDLSRVPEPIGGFPAVPTSKHNTARELKPVAVDDVYADERAGYVKRRVRALARIDLLDKERRDGSISEAAYQAGRTVERVFERMSRVAGSGQWLAGDRLDSATQAQVAAALGFENAIKVNAYLTFLLRHLGKRDARLLWAVLGLRLKFQTIALAEHRPGIRGVRYIADRFRDALGVLAEAKSAKGKALR